MLRRLHKFFTTNSGMESAVSQKHLSFARNCEKATLQPVNGTIITGEIPAWLEGTLIRNGAGILKVGNSRFQHFFDGLGILHRFHIKNGKVTYNRRPLESDAYTDSIAAGRIVSNEFGTNAEPDPCESLFSKFKTIFVSGEKNKSEVQTDNCNVNVGYFGDQLYAMTETPYPRRIDPTTLATIGGKTAVEDYLPLDQILAHPHILSDGTIITMGTNFRHKDGARYVIVKVPPSFGSEGSAFENSTVLGEIKARWRFYPCYSHSFSLAGDNVVFVEQPYCFSIPRFLFRRIRSATVAECFQWWPKETTRIHVVSTINGKANEIIYETKDFFVFHHVNSYEENGHIIMDVSGYNSAEFIGEALWVNKPQKQCDFSNSLRRYVLPLQIPEDSKPGENLVKLESSKASASLRKGTKNVVNLLPDVIVPSYFELPRINYDYNGKKYRYAYGVIPEKGSPEDTLPNPTQIAKVDMEKRTTIAWTENGAIVSEPIFVLNPLVTNPKEDDGVLLFTVLHFEDERKVTLVVLDARDMKEVTKVQFQGEGAVTTTLHGQWAQNGNTVHKY